MRQLVAVRIVVQPVLSGYTAYKGHNVEVLTLIIDQTTNHRMAV